jgi:glycosyltransferase involved in cell wall biosynthesis
MSSSKQYKIDRMPTAPPVIAPVLEGAFRPRWSVMIPVYNCIQYLEETIVTVLSQYKGREYMEIVVVDDASTDGDVEGLVARAGKGVIGYFKQDENVGSLRNFETCIKISKGYYIHLLHGDDQIKEGFYEEIDELFDTYPHIGAAFTSYEYMDEKGKRIWDTPIVSTQKGVLKNWLTTIAQKQMIQPPAKVVKRSSYERLGAFYGVHYGEDWEMWVRIAMHYTVAYSPKVLARYRVHEKNISGRSMRTGQNIRDIDTVIKTIRLYLPDEQRDKITAISRRNFAEYYVRLSHKFYHEYNDTTTAVRQAIGSMSLYPNFLTLRLGILLLLKVVTGYKYFRRFVEKVS